MLAETADRNRLIAGRGNELQHLCVLRVTVRREVWVEMIVKTAYGSKFISSKRY